MVHVLTKHTNHLDLYQLKAETFLLYRNSYCTSSLEEVIGQEKIKDEELELLVKFVEATLAHVQKEDYVEHFTPVISPFVPNHAH